MKADGKEVGKRIETLLNQRNMTQRELAGMIDVTDVSVSRYIRGLRVPKADIILKIANALHTTTDYLLGCESDDTEADYYRALRDVQRYGKDWSKEQKADLVIEMID